MNSWTPVKIINDKLEHFGSGGTVVSGAPRHDDKGNEIVDVKLDVDGEVYEFNTADLQAL